MLCRLCTSAAPLTSECLPEGPSRTCFPTNHYARHLQVDGQPVADDGTAEFRDDERLECVADYVPACGRAGGRRWCALCLACWGNGYRLSHDPSRLAPTLYQGCAEIPAGTAGSSGGSTWATCCR
jgi:hypothetical protein